MKYIKTALVSIMLLLFLTPAAGASQIAQAESEEWKTAFFLQPDGREMTRLKLGAEMSLYDDYNPMIKYLEKYNAELDFSKAWIGTIGSNHFANYGQLAEYIDAYKEIYDYEGRDEKINIDLDMFMNYDGIPIKRISPNDHNRHFVVPAYSNGKCVALFHFYDPSPYLMGDEPHEEWPNDTNGSGFICFSTTYPVSGEPSLWSNVSEAYEAVKALGADIQGIYTVSDTYYYCRESSIGKGYTLYYTPKYTDADGKRRNMLPYDGIHTFDVITLKTDQGIYIYRVPKDEYWASIPETHQLFTMEDYAYHLESEHQFLNVKLQPSASATAPEETESAPTPSPTAVRTPRPTRTPKKTVSALSASAPESLSSPSGPGSFPPAAVITLSPASENEPQSSLPLMAAIAVLSCAIAGAVVWAVRRHIKKSGN